MKHWLVHFGCDNKLQVNGMVIAAQLSLLHFSVDKQARKLQSIICLAEFQKVTF